MIQSRLVLPLLLSIVGLLPCALPTAAAVAAPPTTSTTNNRNNNKKSCCHNNKHYPDKMLLPENLLILLLRLLVITISMCSCFIFLQTSNSLSVHIERLQRSYQVKWSKPRLNYLVWHRYLAQQQHISSSCNGGSCSSTSDSGSMKKTSVQSNEKCEDKAPGTRNFPATVSSVYLHVLGQLTRVTFQRSRSQGFSVLVFAMRSVCISAVDCRFKFEA